MFISNFQIQMILKKAQTIINKRIVTIFIKIYSYITFQIYFKSLSQLILFSFSFMTMADFIYELMH